MKDDIKTTMAEAAALGMVKPSAKPEEPKPTVTLVFTGVDFDDAGERFYNYDTVEGWPDKPVRGKVRSFKKCLLPSYSRPGTVFTIETQGETSVSLNTYKVLDRWPDDDHRLRWQAASEAAVAAHAEAKRLKELMSGSASAERLEPFKQAYKAAPAVVRRQMLAEIIRYITT